VAGGQRLGRHAVQHRAEFTGRGVECAFGAVAVETDRVRATAEAGELAAQSGQGAERGQGSEVGQRGWDRAGDDGTPSRAWRFVEVGCRGGGCLAVSVPPRWPS
jgi:hypothetical protein